MAKLWRFIDFSGSIAGATADAGTNNIVKAAHGLTNGTPVQFSGGTSLPNPLALNTTYWVINAAGGTFQVSTYPGGPTVDITSAGVGPWVVNTRTVTLNMNDRAGWYLGAGLDLGKNALAATYLEQDGIDGAELAIAWRPPVEMTVPLILTEQSTSEAIEILMNALNAQLRKLTNIIEYLPDGLDPLSGSYLIDTFQADEVVLHRGKDDFSPWLTRDGDLLELSIKRQPLFRGRGVIV